MTPQTEAIRLLNESLAENESAKGSLLAAVQKLSRAAVLLNKNNIKNWCSVQLGDKKYTEILSDLLLALQIKDSDEQDEKVDLILKKLEDLGLDDMHFNDEELNVKVISGGGGYLNIGFIEERYADLVRLKKGNDGTYYKNNLNAHINYVRRRSHELASELLNQVRFLGTSSNCFDVLRMAVDDKLLDLNPTLAEQLMIAFRGVSSSGEEEWSQAMATCRRLLEGLADVLYPPNSDAAKGRILSQAQYVNRLWAFMDKSIESDTNKELAKVHVDFLGAWMEKTNKIANKGVHADVGQIEAVKAVFHTYLVVADILEYLKGSGSKNSRPDINVASMDEIEALLDIKRVTAKEIIKARVTHGTLDVSILRSVPGVGVKTVEKAIALFTF